MGITKANQPHSNEHWPNGWWVTRVAETGSTNTDLVKLGAVGAKHHSVLMADFQSAGKGRLDRTWVAEPGANLLVSLLFRTNETQERPLHQFTQMVGMSAARACQQLTGVLPDMKWPNDLLIDNKKVSGILAQGALDFVVVGIGVNVNWAPPDAMSLAQAAPHHATSPVQLLHNMLIAIDELEALSPEQLHEQYSAMLATLGQAVRVELATGDIVEGRAIEVQRDGRLVVLDDCAISHYIDTGDVVHLRAQ
jgi:BirA family biotin operon repressor/biotin-[acetyl-CoA-carboxylase] ligase